MLLLSGAITGLYLVGVGLVAFTEGIRSNAPGPATES
jgi:hypothetical protein